MSDAAQDEPSPVEDWATDFDHTHPDYAARAPEIWDDLRVRCPVAHTDRFEGAWLPTRHADVVAIAHDSDHFSSEGVIVNFWKPDGELAPVGYAPPITSDPPFHQTARRILLPAFAPKEIAKWEPAARESCRALLDAIATSGSDLVDAAVQYAQEIPVRVIADMLGLPREDGDKLRSFIHQIIESPTSGEELAEELEGSLDAYLDAIIAEHRAVPRDDLIGFLLRAELDGVPLTDDHIRGTLALLFIAGIDTTWSAIGASLWHLAQVPADRRRLVDDPDVLPFAVEEFLRFYAPVTMARIVADDVEVGGTKLGLRDWVLLPFPAANRDPAAFEQAGEFVIDRERNRHVAFGLGIHRCLGSNLARLELTVAIDEWMRRFPDFELADDDPSAVRWSAGQVRGPRQLPVRLLRSAGAG